ncbi:MAG: MFS transporter [Sandaracinaceae bacterium]|nr:MFS transporter [Sandaracinaceae bacterium]
MLPDRKILGLPARTVATVAVLLGLVVGAFEGTVVTTAMPTIARELSGMHLYPWVFSGYLVASMAGILLAGKLADAFGRRPVFAVGMSLFLVGSALCGTATSLAGLVAFRVVQGLGAGAIQPLAMTVTADLYTLEERARIQAVFTSSWGIASVLGPVLGGFIVTHLSWRWVFLVNVPVGVLAIVVMLASYRDPPREQRPVGAYGALLGGLAAATALLALEPSHVSTSARLLSLLLAATLLVLFLRDQQRSAAPIVDRAALTDPIVRTGLITSAFAGAMLHTSAAYVPLWMSLHASGNPMRAGLALTPLLFGWAIGSSFGVKILVRRGMRASVGGGFAVMAVSAVLLSLAVRWNQLTLAAIALALTGLGLGPAASTSLVGPQNQVPHHQRGAVTSAIFASRALGGSLAVALVGALPHRARSPDPDASAAFDALALLALAALSFGLLLSPRGSLARSEVVVSSRAS